MSDPDPGSRRGLDRPIAALITSVAGLIALVLGVSAAFGDGLTTTTWLLGAVALAVGFAAVLAVRRRR